jgi:predicted small lipoprotein YifL
MKRFTILTLALVCLVAGPLAGCGKLGPPEPPPHVKNIYPKAYPSDAN